MHLHLDSFQYEPDPIWDQRTQEDDAYRRELAAAGFDSATVEAIERGETLTGDGRRIASLPNLENLTAYDAGAEPVDEHGSTNPIDVVKEHIASAEAQANDEGGTYDGIEQVMRRDVNLDGSGSKSGKRRIDPAIMGRPSSEEAHRKLCALPGGRPLMGSEPRVTISARVDVKTRDALKSVHGSLGLLADILASFIARGMTSSQIQEALILAEKSGIISAPGQTPVSYCETMRQELTELRAA